MLLEKCLKHNLIEEPCNDQACRKFFKNSSQSELIFGLGGHVEFPIDRKITNLVEAHPMKILVNHDGRHVMTITDHMPGKVYNGNLRVDK